LTLLLPPTIAKFLVLPERLLAAKRLPPPICEEFMDGRTRYPWKCRLD
jgi:hypothetical protein